MSNVITRLILPLLLTLPLIAQSPKTIERGSIIEDRAARKLLQAGDARLEVGGFLDMLKKRSPFLHYSI